MMCIREARPWDRLLIFNIIELNRKENQNMNKLGRLSSIVYLSDPILLIAPEGSCCLTGQ